MALGPFIPFVEYKAPDPLDRYDPTPYKEDDPHEALRHILGKTKDPSLKRHLEAPARLAVRHEAERVLWAIIDCCAQVSPRITLGPELVGEAVDHGSFKSLALLYNTELAEWWHPAFDAMYQLPSEYEVFHEHCRDPGTFFLQVQHRATSLGDYHKYRRASFFMPFQQHPNMTHLCTAIEHKQHEMASRVYEQGAPLDSHVVRTLIKYVREPGNPLDYLLRLGVKSDPQLALDFAAECGAALSARYAIEEGAKVDEDTVAAAILTGGDLETVKTVVDGHADLVGQDVFDTAAVAHTPTALMSYLMDQGYRPSEVIVRELAKKDNGRLLKLFFDRGVPTTGAVSTNPATENLIRSYFPTIWDALDD